MYKERACRTFLKHVEPFISLKLVPRRVLFWGLLLRSSTVNTAQSDSGSSWPDEGRELRGRHGGQDRALGAVHSALTC